MANDDVVSLFEVERSDLDLAKKELIDANTGFEWALRKRDEAAERVSVARSRLCVAAMVDGAVEVRIERYHLPHVNGLEESFRVHVLRVDDCKLVELSEVRIEYECHTSRHAAMSLAYHDPIGTQAMQILCNEKFLGEDEDLVVFRNRCFRFDGGWQEIG